MDSVPALSIGNTLLGGGGPADEEGDPNKSSLNPRAPLSAIRCTPTVPSSTAILDPKQTLKQNVAQAVLEMYLPAASNCEL